MVVLCLTEVSQLHAAAVGLQRVWWRNNIQQTAWNWKYLFLSYVQFIDFEQINWRCVLLSVIMSLCNTVYGLIAFGVNMLQAPQ